MSRAFVLAAVSFLSLVTACAECPVPIPPRAQTLTGWSISEGGAASSAREDGGVVRIGENPASVATKSFDCGSAGGRCNITFPVSGPNGVSDQSMTVRFGYGTPEGRKERAITFHRQPGASEHPIHLSLPTCGKIDVSVSGDAAGKPTIESPFGAGPFYVECRDCELKERGTKGT